VPRNDFGAYNGQLLRFGVLSASHVGMLRHAYSWR
jgi:hypothetical protein